MYFFNPQMILIHSIKFEWDLEGIFSSVKFSKKKIREKTSVDVTDFYSAGSRMKNTYHLHKNSRSFVFLQKTKSTRIRTLQVFVFKLEIRDEQSRFRKNRYLFSQLISSLCVSRLQCLAASHLVTLLICLMVPASQQVSFHTGFFFFSNFSFRVIF